MTRSHFLKRYPLPAALVLCCLLLAACEEAEVGEEEQRHVVPVGYSLEPLAVTPADAHHNLMLPNGARFYIDHAHPEYCTPE